MEPLVSILIPAYNAERWIADTLRSAIEQTWPRKEIIVVDDGSTDNTLSAAKKSSSSLVNVITQDNQGAAAARNKAVSMSQGDYIQWLDADDILAPDKVERQLAVVEENNLSTATLLSGPWAYFYHRTKAAKFSPTPLWRDLSAVDWFVTKWRYNLHMQTGTWLISRQLTEKVGQWDVRLLTGDDGEYLCRIIKNCEGIKFVEDAKTFYRMTDANRVSHAGKSRGTIEAQWLGMQLQIAHVRSAEDSPRTREACVRFLQTWLLLFYPERMDLVEQMQTLAESLGGKLQTPSLSWKYAWISHCFGLTTAKRARAWYNWRKVTLLKSLSLAAQKFERLSNVFNDKR